LNEFVNITSETYDVLIIRLGENVSNTAEYYTALNNMINLFKTQNKSNNYRNSLGKMLWENYA
jgi:plasmid maintenance system antidote protein VapI